MAFLLECLFIDNILSNCAKAFCLRFTAWLKGKFRLTEFLATVTVNVTTYVIDAVDDVARGSSKAANTPLASVLANDTLGGVQPTTATVSLTKVSLTPANSSIQLNVVDGSVNVLGKTISGIYSLVYRICEIANPGNCDQATVSLDLTGK